VAIITTRVETSGIENIATRWTKAIHDLRPDFDFCVIDKVQSTPASDACQCLFWLKSHESSQWWWKIAKTTINCVNRINFWILLDWDYFMHAFWSISRFHLLLGMVFEILYHSFWWFGIIKIQYIVNWSSTQGVIIMAFFVHYSANLLQFCFNSPMNDNQGIKISANLPLRRIIEIRLSE